MPIATASGFARPTFEEILAGRHAGYQRLFGAFPEDGILARLVELDGEMMHSLHGHIEYVAQQFHPLHATGQWLLDWGLVLIGPLKAAAAAIGTVRITGVNGTALGAGLRLARGDGAEFEAVSGGTVVGGVADLAIRASAAGIAGNSDAGIALSLVNPVLGMDASGSVLVPGLTGGADAESMDAYRARYLLRLREPPQGGNDTDHITWTLQVPGVTRAWVRRGVAGSGEVLVLFMTDGATADGIPVGGGGPDYTGDLLAVHQHLEAVAPSPGVRVVKAPVPKPIDYVIHGLDPDTPEIRAAIEAELADLHRRRAEPGKAWRWSWGAEAVTAVAGEDGYDGIEPAASVVCATDEIATFGSVAYVP